MKGRKGKRVTTLLLENNGSLLSTDRVYNSEFELYSNETGMLGL